MTHEIPCLECGGSGFFGGNGPQVERKCEACNGTGVLNWPNVHEAVFLCGCKVIVTQDPFRQFRPCGIELSYCPLHAAAWGLLAALQEVPAWFEEWSVEIGAAEETLLGRVNAAIAKATARPSAPDLSEPSSPKTKESDCDKLRYKP